MVPSAVCEYETSMKSWPGQHETHFLQFGSALVPLGSVWVLAHFLASRAHDIVAWSAQNHVSLRGSAGLVMLLAWFRHGSAMVPPWFRHDSAWFRHGSDRFRHGSAMVPPWFCQGSTMFPPWFCQGSAMVLGSAMVPPEVEVPWPSALLVSGPSSGAGEASRQRQRRIAAALETPLPSPEHKQLAATCSVCGQQLPRTAAPFPL